MLGQAAENYMPQTAREVTAPLDVDGTSRAALGLLGSQIGCALNSADRQKAVTAVQITTESGQTQSWTGTQDGVSGRTDLVSDSGDCRTVQQTVTLSDGTDRSGQVRSCKGPDGWVPTPE